ncbi:MAG: DUF4835 family protein [Chitinophagales bacterium]
MRLKIFTLFITILSFNAIVAQELNCEVSVLAPDASKISADQKIFKTLENDLSEFMSSRKWTNDVFSENERIECSILIGITNQNGENEFEGTMTVISKRPVFNSDYQSTVLNIIDQEIKFSYTEHQAIEFNENQFYDNLGHLMGYYAYLIIGVDYDTFSEQGGTKYLEKAAEIVNVVSPSEGNTYSGWKSTEKNPRNRYWLINSMLNSRYENFRKAMYQYHRLGLDLFYSDEVKGREGITAALELLEVVGEDNPNLPIMRTWSDSKALEVANIYKEATDAEKTAVLKLLEVIDGINIDKYQKITEK